MFPGGECLESEVNEAVAEAFVGAREQVPEKGCEVSRVNRVSEGSRGRQFGLSLLMKA